MKYPRAHLSVSLLLALVAVPLESGCKGAVSPGTLHAGDAGATTPSSETDDSEEGSSSGSTADDGGNGSRGDSGAESLTSDGGVEGRDAGAPGNGSSDAGGGMDRPPIMPITKPVEAPLSGPSGVWQSVSPADVSFQNNWGALDVLADPAHPGSFFAFLDKNGVYQSLDWGASWAKVSTDGMIEHGSPWGEAIAPDGSYMLASVGYPDNGNHGAWKSTNGGATWKSYNMSSNNDPYSFDIDPSNARHALATMHGSDEIFESLDGGETWRNRGSAGTSLSCYVFFITSSTWLSIPQDGGNEKTRRTTDSGASWADVAPARHAHGNAQIFVVPETKNVYIGSHEDGVFRSTDNGATFTLVSNTRASTLFGTDRFVYASDPGANFEGTPALLQKAQRSDGTAWSAVDNPPAMSNGSKRAAVAYDAASKRWVIIGGNWRAGLWRYIEPSN